VNVTVFALVRTPTASFSALHRRSATTFSRRPIDARNPADLLGL